MKRFFKNKKGFTLIELIVVMAILGILAAIALPRFTGMRDEAAITADGATAAQIANACRIQEVRTGSEVGSLGELTDANLRVAAPQSGGTFTVGGGGADPYTVRWTPDRATNTFQQTYTEGIAFTISTTAPTPP